MGSILTVSGPRGIGKSVVMGGLRDRYRVQPIVPYTTRDMRKGEAEGVDYRYVTKNEFGRLRRERPMFDVLPLNGNLYGTPLQDFLDVFKGKGLRTVNMAAESALKLRGELRNKGRIACLFLLPASWNDIGKQMRAGGIAEDKIMERRTHEPTDLTRLPEFDQIVVNRFGKQDETLRSVVDFVRSTLHERL